MKKIISFLLLAAMLIGCIVPAALVSAADSALAAGSAEVMEGSSTATAAVSISGNPGVAYVKFAVTFKTAELALNDATSDLFGSSVSNVRANQLANYIPEGENKDDYKGIFVTLEHDEFINVTADGVIASLLFDLVAPEVGATYNYYVTFEEACDENEEDVVIAGELLEGSISYIKDENLGKYDEFTMFFAPESVDVKAGEMATVDLRVDANPGLWSIRCMIVYPEALSVAVDGEGAALVTNGSVFKPQDLNVGIANLPLTADNLLPKYKEMFIAEGIEMEGYNSLVLYYEPEDPAAVISNNGVLATIPFNTDNAVAGETYEIKVYYVTGDIFRAEGGTNFTDLFPETVSTTINTIACQHTSTHVDKKDADCGNNGYEKTICDECGATVSETVLNATGAHAYGEEVEVNAPTCSAEGLNTQTCTVCGDVKEIPVDKLPHTPGAGATCSSAQTCTVCGEELAAKLDHVAGDPVTDPATCTEDGSKTVSCTLCGEVISTEVLKAPGHNYLQPGSTVIVPPTCTEGGYTQKTCQVCGDVAIMDKTDPDGHEWGDPVVVTEPTCTEKGAATKTCEFCGEVEDITIDELGHNTVVIEAVAATCYTDGSTEGSMCSTCGEVFVEPEVIPGGHTIVEFEAVEPGCHYIGNIAYWFCSTCESFWADADLTLVTNSKSVILPATGSENLQHVEAKAPTATEKGNIEYWYCPDCEQFWQDEALTQLTNSKRVILPELGEEADDDSNNDANNDANNETVKPSKPTGDNMMLIIIALAVVAMGSVAIVVIRRKRNAQ